jgi:ABC-type transport system involved in multi-copper enzyme maturation permease subunit
MRTALVGALAIARATWLEAIRSRLLSVSIFFALVLVGLSVAAASVSFGERSRLIVDVGLAAASGVGSLIAIALSVTSFAGELDRRTAYALLARPVPRWAFVLGKYLGVVATMEVVVTAMVGATAVTVWLYGDSVPWALWGCLWLAYVEIALVVAMAMFFSSLSVPVLAATYSIGVLLAGNLASDVAAYAVRVGVEHPTLGAVVRGLYFLLPDLERLSLRNQAANDLPVGLGHLAVATAYGLTFAAALLTLTMWIFSRRKAV